VSQGKSESLADDLKVNGRAHLSSLTVNVALDARCVAQNGGKVRQLPLPREFALASS
jgi:hypothetical protein